MTIPQAAQIEERNMRGPIFRAMTVMGGWNITYVGKKSITMIDCVRLSIETGSVVSR